MAKATSRKHAMHHKKARAHQAVKAHARRSNVSSSSPSTESRPMDIKQETVFEENINPRSENRVVDDPLDDEVGIYGANRGETAG